MIKRPNNSLFDSLCFLARLWRVFISFGRSQIVVLVLFIIDFDNRGGLVGDFLRLTALRPETNCVNVPPSTNLFIHTTITDVGVNVGVVVELGIVALSNGTEKARRSELNLMM